MEAERALLYTAGDKPYRVEIEEITEEEPYPGGKPEKVATVRFENGRMDRYPASWLRPIR